MINRIAILPNHDSGGVPIEVKESEVFDFVSEEWSQVGADILVATQPISRVFHGFER
jgi:hypothetical protein